MLPKKTKICISTQHLGMGGGVGRQVNLLADYLFKKGYKPEIMFSANIRKNLFFNESFKPVNKELLKNTKITKTYIPLFWPQYYLYGRMMKDKAKQAQVCHQIGGSCLEASPFYLAKKRYICWPATTFRDEWKSVSNLKDLSRPGSWLLRGTNTLTIHAIRNLEKRIYQKAEIINPVSQRTAELIHDEFNIPHSKLRVLPNPVDMSQFERKIKKRFDFEYVIYVGRLDKRKNLETFILAFKHMQKKGLKLVIFGDGPERQHLEDYAKKLGVSNDVIFTGFQDDDLKIDYLKQAKVFGMSSTQEGFGISIIEAMACGVPVVSTDCGGPRDIITDKENGFFVKIGDYKQMAQKIRLLLGNERLRKSIGESARKEVRGRFDIKIIGKKILDEYEEIAT